MADNAHSVDPPTAPIADDVLPVEHLQVLRLEPGDVVVMSWPEPLTLDDADRMHQMLKSAFPRNRSLIIDSDGQIGVIRPVPNNGRDNG